MIQAQIAKSLVAEHPELREPDQRKTLLGRIEEIYQRDHAVIVQIDPARLDGLRTAWQRAYEVPALEAILRLPQPDDQRRDE